MCPETVRLDNMSNRFMHLVLTHLFMLPRLTLLAASSYCVSDFVSIFLMLFVIFCVSFISQRKVNSQTSARLWIRVRTPCLSMQSSTSKQNRSALLNLEVSVPSFTLVSEFSPLWVREAKEILRREKIPPAQHQFWKVYLLLEWERNSSLPGNCWVRITFEDERRWFSG